MVINCPSSIIYYCRHCERESCDGDGDVAGSATVRSLPSSTLLNTRRSLMGIIAQSNAATGPPVLYGSWWTHISDRVMRGSRGCPFLYIFVTFLKFGNSALGFQSPKLTLWCREKRRTQRKLYRSEKRGRDTAFDVKTAWKKKHKTKQNKKTGSTFLSFFVLLLYNINLNAV